MNPSDDVGEPTAEELKAYAAGYADGLKGFADLHSYNAAVEPAQREWTDDELLDMWARAPSLASFARDLLAQAHPQHPAGEPDDTKVICPACVHQFRAIPVQVQKLMLAAGFEPPFDAAPSIPAGGPVAWQFRCGYYNESLHEEPGWGAWQHCTEENYQRLAGKHGYQIRALYTSVDRTQEAETTVWEETIIDPPWKEGERYRSVNGVKVYRTFGDYLD